MRAFVQTWYAYVLPLLLHPSTGATGRLDIGGADYEVSMENPRPERRETSAVPG
jgi:hypothetical protein